MRVVFRLTKYAFRHKWYLVGAYAAMVASTLSAMVIPRILGDAIDEALASGLQSRLLLLAGAIVVFSLLRGVFSFSQRYLSESLSQRSAYDLREDFFKKLQSMSFGFFDKEQTGDLMSKATQDVEAVRMFISMGMVRGLSIFVMVGAVSVLMATTNWRLAIVSMAFVPLILWRALAMSNVLRPTWMKVQEEMGAMTTVLQENLSGVKVVKAFGAQGFEQAKFNARSNAVADLTYAATRVFASQGSLMTFIFTAAIGAILWFGGREVAVDRITPGGLASFILYMGLLGMPIRMSGWMVNTASPVPPPPVNAFMMCWTPSLPSPKNRTLCLCPARPGMLRSKTSQSVTTKPEARFETSISKLSPGRSSRFLEVPGLARAR